jgi:hypothetical protein
VYEGIFVDVTTITVWRLNAGGTGSLPKLAVIHCILSIVNLLLANCCIVH